MDDASYAGLLLLIVLLPVGTAGITQYTQVPVEDDNAVGNAFGAVALVTSGVALASTAFLSQEAVGMVETVKPQLTRSLTIEKIYVIQENTDTGKAVQLTLKNSGNNLNIKKLRLVAVGPTFQSHAYTEFKLCSQPVETPCLVPPYADDDLVLERGERLQLKAPLKLEADSRYVIRIETPQGDVERTVKTPSVYTQVYTAVT